MTDARHNPVGRSGALLDRWQSWAAALASALLHVLILLIVLHAAKSKLVPPAGGGMGGARVKVEFIGQPSQGEKRPPAPVTGRNDAEKPQPPRPPKKAPPVQATRVAKAAAPIPPEKPQPRQTETNDSAGQQRRAQPPTGDPAARRSATPAGQAPGLLARETAPNNTGSDRGASRSQVPGPAAPGREPRMDVDGHQIYYDIRNEDWLLDWQAQGMTELWFPLPGRRDYMVCELAIVVRRGSGNCRVVQPDDPELAKIGDARKVVNVVRVYRRGELVWQGPGAYR